VSDLKQEADSEVHPFAFKPLQLASLVDPKSLETLESMGGVDALLRGLGTKPTHGLSTKHDTPTRESFEDMYRTTIEDRQRIYGQNVIPRRSSKTLFQLVWLTLQDKVLV
jgi:Ca2+-transporting ATPase